MPLPVIDPNVPTDFLHRAYAFYVSLGYTPAGAAAMAASAGVESGGNPTIKGDGGTSIGTFQWHDPKPGEGRMTKLMQWAADPSKETGNGTGQALDPMAENTQLGFADWETHNTHSAVGDRIRNAKTPEEATRAVTQFLAPKSPTGKTEDVPSYPQRLDLTGKVMTAFGDPSDPASMAGMNQPPPAPPPAQGGNYDFANLSGPYGGLGNTPAPNAAAVAQMQGAGKPQNFAGATQAGLGLMQASQPQQDWAQQAMQRGAPMGQQPQAHRPQAGGQLPQMPAMAGPGGGQMAGMQGGNTMQTQLAGLLSDPSMDPQKKQMLMGLLGA